MREGERAARRGDVAAVEAAEVRCERAQASLERLIEGQLAAHGEKAPQVAKDRIAAAFAA